MKKENLEKAVSLRYQLKDTQKRIDKLSEFLTDDEDHENITLAVYFEGEATPLRELKGAPIVRQALHAAIQAQQQRQQELLKEVESL